MYEMGSILGQYGFRKGVKTFWPEICFPGLTTEAPGSLHWQFDPLKLNSAFILTSQLQPLLRLHTMAQLIQATTAPTLRSSKPRMLVARANE